VLILKYSAPQKVMFSRSGDERARGENPGSNTNSREH